MRSEGSLRTYLLSSKMTKESTWTTELEIIAMSHMLNVDIYTYSDKKWLQFNGEGQYYELGEQREAIYLYHRQQNHYDVVLHVSTRVSEKESDTQKRSCRTEYTQRKKNRIRMKTKRNTFESKVSLDSIEKRKDAFKKKYRENEKFRMKILEQKKNMYSNSEFKMKMHEKNEERYHDDIGYRSNLIQQGIQKYALDLEYRKEVQTTSRRRSKVKYLTDLNHRQEKKEKSVKKYKLDAQHREQVKEKSKEKYRTNYEYQEKVKKASTEKYKTNLEHKENVKKASTEKYKIDLEHQENVKKASIKINSM